MGAVCCPPPKPPVTEDAGGKVELKVGAKLKGGTIEQVNTTDVKVRMPDGSEKWYDIEDVMG
eukprot:CAMPEP_0178411000 /NCGR_PEP_ID=MMETSP0689_2-20121128/21271_1 /TAXON_ID=160604 /ORGANISM="Amphidinium massartii, Strain CS-259" /LENGTH=61 /DNA_ID=CAMNT_0020032197 /DNA_START=90 /DNA_END=275 /DNA_ORIENTATION=+